MKRSLKSTITNYLNELITYLWTYRISHLSEGASQYDFILNATGVITYTILIVFKEEGTAERMRISHQFKFIFFSNPKTGSESVRALLDHYSEIKGSNYKKITKENPFYSHITPKETREIFIGFDWNFDIYTKFVFVRNPWARLVSLYKMIYSRKYFWKYSRKYMRSSFSKWLFKINTHGTGGGGKDWQRWRRYGTYSLDNFIMDESRNIMVDKIIKLEDIQYELIPFLITLNLPNIEKAKIPNVNIGRSRHHYTDFYTSETAKYVEKLYEYDINEFGYKYGD